MNKTVWIVHQYASTPETGIGGRHFYFARELVKQGYNVYLIASASHHLLRHKVEMDGAYKVEQVDGFNMVWINMPDYQEAHSKQRALNWFVFSLRIQKLALIIPDKPDVVLCSSPSPISFLGAQRIAKKFKARLVFEVRDIWPLTLTEIGGYSPKHPFIRFMQWVEDKAYRESDAVVSNLKNSVEHMVSRGMDKSKFSWVPNGFSLDEVTQNTPLNQETASKLPMDKFIVGYTGTLGVANAIDTLIESAEQLKNNSDIVFVLVGAGKEKRVLQQSVIDKDLDNVIFIDPIPKVEIQAMLSRFDACYIGWLNDDLYRFGIGANKIPEYLYSGKPIIHAYSGAFDPIVESGAGVLVPAQDSVKLADSVLKLYQAPIDERRNMGVNGRKLALAEYEYGELSKFLVAVLFGIKSVS
ncbi:glycosyltransferase family 4 protein [Marinomonas sp. 5E14-1]|uniref:glycosyltransferase family 4 protein n=1 Tax=Marinomonas sp. 5E14-1 TaxID=3153922 RepID=UPI0032637A99